MPVLKLASCMAENSEPFCQNVTAYIQARLGIETGYVNDIPWQERERLFDEGEIQILWLCGLPYVYKADQPESDMELLAVPVPYRLSVSGKGDLLFRCHRKEGEPLSNFRGAAWSGVGVQRAAVALRLQHRSRLLI